jgi:hypothetical protein
VDLWHFIKRANASQIWQVICLSLGNIRLLWPTYRATKKAVQYSNTYFGTKHNKNTPANAFRHAVWNYLIASECAHWSKNDAKVMAWTNKITHLHELILPKNELADAMDLHNNAVGLLIYTTNKALLQEETINLLLAMVKRSVKINSMGELTNIPKDQFVHITEITTT